MASSPKILAELVDHITAKQRLYRTAFAADLDQLRRRYGETVLVEVLRRIELKPHTDAWDRRGHSATVRRAIGRLLQRRAEDPESFSDDGVKV